MVDKIVTNLDADHVRICPDQVAKVTAETSPPNTPVVWAIDGKVISVLIGNTIIIGDAVHPVGQGQRVTVEARLDNTLSKEIVRSASRADVTLQPSPVDRVYAITSEPAMPAISALASGIGGDITVLKWGVKVLIDPTFVFEICLGMPPALQKTFDFSPAGGGSAIDVDFGGAIRGGRFEISVDGTVNDCPVTGAAAASLVGTNPRRSDIQASFPNDTIRRIACRESGQRQFNAPPDGGIGHCPLVRRADHVGIMQLAGPTDEQVWNWRANLDRGIEIFSERLDDARAYPGQVSLSAGFQDLVAQFNDIRQLDGKPALTIKAPEFSTGDLDDNLQQLELDAIRGYDGWFGDDRFGFELHEYRIGVDSIEGRDVLRVTDIDENVLTASGVWERVPPDDRPPSEGDPRYVESVLAFGAFCGAADPKPDPCGATLRLLNHQNHAINPADQALSVSNNVSDDTSLGSEAVAFDAISLDRTAFRFEIENPVPDHPVNIALIVGDRLPVLYGLDAKSGNRYRSPLIRLVSDEEDSRALGLLNTQNVLVRLGDELVALYEPGSGCVEKARMRVGRPFTEQNNDHPDHSRHDIRDMRLRMTVFSRPAVSALLADISEPRSDDTTSERSRCSAKRPRVDRARGQRRDRSLYRYECWGQPTDRMHSRCGRNGGGSPWSWDTCRLFFNHARRIGGRGRGRSDNGQ